MSNMDVDPTTDPLSGAPAPAPDYSESAAQGSPSYFAPSPTAAPAPTGAPAEKPSMWKEILMGALSGLAGSKGATNFGTGAAGGAGGYLAHKQQEQENQDTANALAQKKAFNSMQAANAAATAAREDAKLHLLSEAQQEKHFEFASKERDAAEKVLGPPTMTFPNTAEGAASAMHEQIANGGINHFRVINDGKTIHLWDTASISSRMLPMVNVAGEALGDARLANLTPDQMSKMSDAQRADISDREKSFSGTVIPEKTLGGITAQLGTWNRYQRTLSGKVASKPELQDALTHANDMVKQLKETHDEMLGDSLKEKAAGRSNMTVNLSEDAKDIAARYYARKGVLPPGFSRAPQAVADVMNRAAEINKDTDIAENSAAYDVYKKKAKDAQQSFISFRTLDQHLDRTDKAAAALGNGDMKVLNDIANFYHVKVQGKNPVTIFNAIITVAGPEIVRATAATGQMGETEIKNARDNFASGMPYGQVHGNVMAFKDLVSGKRNALVENLFQLQHGDMTGGSKTTPTDTPGGAAPKTIRARDPQGKLHEAAPGTTLPKGWKLEN